MSLPTLPWATIIHVLKPNRFCPFIRIHTALQETFTNLRCDPLFLGVSLQRLDSSMSQVEDLWRSAGVRHVLDFDATTKPSI